MDEPPGSAPFYAKRPYRLVSGAFGAFVLGVGIYALFFAGPPTALRLAGGIGLVVLGANMVAAAYAAKESWLSRIGPLP